MPSARTGPKKKDQKVTITPSLSNCDENITLDCLRALYNVNYQPVATDKNSYGIGMLLLHCKINYIILNDPCDQLSLPLRLS